MPDSFSILLIDTDPQLIETLTDIVADSFPGLALWQVNTAAEAKESIAPVNAQLPDAIGLSINLLDRTNELNFLAWLRASNRTRQLPVLLLTNGILPCDVVDSYRFSATSFVIRPFSRDDWQAWLRSQVALYAG